MCIHSAPPTTSQTTKPLVTNPPTGLSHRDLLPPGPSWSRACTSCDQLREAASRNKHFTCLENNVTGKKLKSWPNKVYPIRLTPCGWNTSDRQQWQGLTWPDLKWGLIITPGLQGTPLGWVWGTSGSEELPPGSSKAKARRLNSIFISVHCKENDSH